MNDVPATEWKSFYSGPRGTAVKILNRVERTDSYLDKVLDSELRSGELSDPDKGLLNEIVHGVLRWQNKLDWVLNGFSHGNFSKSEINVKNTLRVALYQILFLERIPHSAAVNEGVEFIKRIRGDKPAGLVNAVLRNIIRNIEGIRYPDPAEDEVQYLAVFYSHPHWMVKRWLRRYGREETERLMIANNERPSMALRINRLKIDPAVFKNQLTEQQIAFTPSAYLSHFVRVKTLSRIGQMDLFRNGMFTIQDESAVLACQLLDARPGDRVFDLCAAPGGKTTNLSEMMNNTGVIIALDKYEAKLLDDQRFGGASRTAQHPAARDRRNDLRRVAGRSHSPGCPLFGSRYACQETRHEMETGPDGHHETGRDTAGDARKRSAIAETRWYSRLQHMHH